MSEQLEDVIKPQSTVGEMRLGFRLKRIPIKF